MLKFVDKNFDYDSKYLEMQNIQPIESMLLGVA